MFIMLLLIDIFFVLLRVLRPEACSLEDVLLLRFLRVVIGDSECNALFQIVLRVAG